MTRPCIPDPRPAAATERDVRALAAHQLAEATRLGLVDQDVCDPGQSGSHRIVSALRAVEAWLREDGAL